MLALTLTLLMNQTPWVTYEGPNGPGSGRRIVLLAGDEEYRSEEGLPQLAKILARRHGFSCTVFFSINARGEIDPNLHTNQPGMKMLDKADLCILLLRFRSWPDEQMKHFSDFYLAGKPLIGLRTSTHAFDYPSDSSSLYRDYGWNSKTWPGGFGKQVLGETWISHWGNHGSEATRAITEPNAHVHPILKGVSDVFGTTDVYEAAPPPDATILLRGQVVSGMKDTDAPADRAKKTAKGQQQPVNDPMMPIAWIREPVSASGRKNRVFTTTMGAATDLLNEDLRRLLVNATYWGLGMESKTPAKANVDLVGTYTPSPFGFEGFKKGVKPADLAGW